MSVGDRDDGDIHKALMKRWLDIKAAHTIYQFIQYDDTGCMINTRGGSTYLPYASNTSPSLLRAFLMGIDACIPSAPMKWTCFTLLLPSNAASTPRVVLVVLYTESSSTPAAIKTSLRRAPLH